MNRVNVFAIHQCINEGYGLIRIFIEKIRISPTKLWRVCYYIYGICRARNGIGIILSKEWQDKILEIKRISDRIMTMKLVSGNTMFNIISVYASQVGCSQQEKD